MVQPESEARHTLFISDLHLSPDAPETSGRFFRFLAEIAPCAEAIYILGDLFEAWIGDDDLEPTLHRDVIKALRDLSQKDIEICILQGNRDFLLGEVFCRASGARLLTDPTVVDLYGLPTVLMHGDTLCTDDVAYQQFRVQAHNSAWQQAMLAKPLEERRAIARHLRQQSEQSKDGKSAEIMDVNAEAVATAFRTQACTRMIHGHTHRPAEHTSQVDGKTCTRWVLPDWYETGGYLRCAPEGCSLQPL